MGYYLELSLSSPWSFLISSFKSVSASSTRK